MKKEISQVIKWANGMVMVFDKNGEQISEYQGKYVSVKSKILKNATNETKFYYGQWGFGKTEVRKNIW